MLENCELLEPKEYIVHPAGDKNTLIPIIIKSEVLRESTLVSGG